MRPPSHAISSGRNRRRPAIWPLKGTRWRGSPFFFWTYGSFSTKRGLFVEDLFVRPAFRGRGHGRRLLAHLAGKGAARLEWRVLDWNAPSIEFYKRLGAEPVADWSTYMLDGDAMKRLAGT